MRGTVIAAAVFGLLIAGPATVRAQWTGHPTAGMPRLPDGRPDLSAPTPRTADGKPDISGLWLPSTPTVLNMQGGLEPGRVPLKLAKATIPPVRSQLESRVTAAVAIPAIVVDARSLYLLFANSFSRRR